MLIGPRSNKLESVNILGLHFSGTIEPTRDRIYVIDKEVLYLGHLLEHLFHTRDIHYHTFIAIVTPGNPQRSTVGKSHVGRGEEVMNLIHHHKRAEYGSHTHSQLKSEQDSMDRERVGPTVTAGSLMELIAIGEQHDDSRHDKRHHCGRQGIDKEPPYKERTGSSMRQTSLKSSSVRPTMPTAARTETKRRSSISVESRPRRLHKPAPCT